MNSRRIRLPLPLYEDFDSQLYTGKVILQRFYVFYNLGRNHKMPGSAQRSAISTGMKILIFGCSEVLSGNCRQKSRRFFPGRRQIVTVR